MMKRTPLFLLLSLAALLGLTSGANSLPARGLAEAHATSRHARRPESLCLFA